MFSDYPLRKQVQSALAKKNFTTPTAIQEASLPYSLEGKDILGQARTGTGKTLAFGLPIANRLDSSKAKGRLPRALILTPTRELALQVAKELDWVASELKVVAVYGGTGYGKQASELKKGADIVVATPGRALDYHRQGILTLDAIEIVVLDEADEMLSMGFSEDVETLLADTPKERQTMLFSATLPRWAKKLARDHLIDPVHLNLIEDEDVLYQEVAVQAELRGRSRVLSDLLHTHAGEKAIIFTHTKVEVDKLAKELSANGHTAEAIHGDLNQSQRERVLARFRAGQVDALIGTNVAARGLDIPEVDVVIHYRVPNETEAYQHRSGRTGRAGRSGTVILLYGKKEKRDLTALEKSLGRRFHYSDAPTPDTIQSAKLGNLLRRAKEASKENKDAWKAVARDLIQAEDADTLAGLFATILGGAPRPRSLLTGQEGWLTLELSGDLKNPGQVMRIFKEAGASEVGRIQLAKHTAYADVLQEDAERLLQSKNIRKATELKASEQRPAASRKSKGRNSRAKRPKRMHS